MNNDYFLLRHGETIYQTQKRAWVYDWSKIVPLTKKGEKQIGAVAKKLKKVKINLIFSSDLFRTQQTAEIVAKELGLKVNFDKRLRDINLGVYQGRKKQEFYKDFPKTEARFSKAPPGGESWQDCQKRLLDFIKEIDQQHQGKKILIVSHGDPLWLLEGAFAGLNNKELLETRLGQDFIKVGELRPLKMKKEII